MNTSRKKVRQSGFTLIELIIVIVIIGILAAIAVPKYTSLVADAKQAKLDGIGGAIASASATNYVLQASGKGGSAVANCAAAGALVSPAVSTGLAPDGTPTGGAGDAITCTLTVDGVSSAAFSVILTTTYAGS